MVLTPRKVSLPAPSFPLRLFCEASGETGFCEEEPHMQPRLFGQGAIIHVARMLTNALVVLLRQWCWCSKHIPVKHPPRAMGTEGSRTRWFHSLPVVGHRSVQGWLGAAFQTDSQFRRFVGCFSLITSFREIYQRPFSSSKQHIQSLETFPGIAGCSSSVGDHRGVKTQMCEGQEQETDSGWGLQT